MPSIDGRIREMCAEGATTAGDVIAELGIPRNLASAHLSSMFRRGALKRRQFYGGDTHRRCVWIYELAERRAS